jgi:hypothetical protein
MTRDPIRAAILGDGETRIDSFDAAERVRAYLLSDEAVERAAAAVWERADDEVGWAATLSLAATGDAYMVGQIEYCREDARTAIRAAMGGKTDE